MFWNDPLLYGASFPFKDIGIQAPVIPPVLPKFVSQVIPPFYGFTPYQQQITPFVPPVANPYLQTLPLQNLPLQTLPMQNLPLHNLPLQNLPLQNVPPMGINPFVQPFVPPISQPFSFNVPFYGMKPPFAY